MNACPSAEQLRRLLAEQLGEAERDGVEAHVEGCAACQGTLEELTAALVGEGRPGGAAEGWSRHEPDSGFLRRLGRRPPNVPAARGGKGTEDMVPSPGPEATPPAAAGWPQVPGYEILGVLGRGGMGVVYQARQTSLRRLVALKMTLAGSHATGEQQARFRTEAEAVARLQHPNVVQIHEVGEHDGLPFFSLEFVDGGSLANRLDGTPRPPRQAAQVVETLARAVHAAHQRGIVHRDLKPANVLLTGDGVPKITDFGLAKMLDATAGATDTGAVMGTPSYMAPEQTGRYAHPIGPATDVYALGAVLYELLTGRPPFQGETPLATLEQVVADEPVPPRRWQPGVPRDLETVCLKCLRKEPAGRYGSALGLADDLRHFLAGEPIRARPVGPAGRLWRWARRNPKVAGLLATLALVMAAGMVTVTALWLLAEERRRTAEENQALAERRRREARANYLKARDAVDQLTRLGDEYLRHVPQQEKLRRALLAEALRLNQEFLQENSDDPEVRQETARTYNRLGRIHGQLGEPQEAAKLLRRAVDLSKRLTEEFPRQAEYRDDLAEYYHDLGFRLMYTRAGEAGEAFRQGLALRKELVAESPGVSKYRHHLARMHTELGNLLSITGRAPEAEESYRQGQEIWQDLAAVDPESADYQSGLGSTYNNLGHILMDRGERSRAVLGASTVGLMGSALAQGPLLAAPALIPGRTEELPRSRQLLHRAIDHQQRALKVRPFHTQDRWNLAKQYDMLGAIEKRLGQYGEAETAMRQSQAVRQRLADDFPATPFHRSELGGVLNNLAIIQLRQGKLAEARRSAEEAIAHQQAARKMDPEAPQYRQYLYNHYWNLADILVNQGEHAEAVRAAAKLAGVVPDSGANHVVAAWFVARCMPLAEKDAGQPADKRRELVRGYTELAMRYLRDGAAKGGVNVAFIRGEPPFRPLRAREDYKALLADLEAKAKPAPK
jgi:tetratricopeptide (TPR) repeat protein